MVLLVADTKVSIRDALRESVHFFKNPTSESSSVVNDIMFTPISVAMLHDMTINAMRDGFRDDSVKSFRVTGIRTGDPRIGPG